MGVVGIPEYPVFSQNGVNKMLPWWIIDRIEPVEE